MAMDPKLAEKLAEYRRRREGVALRRITATDLLVACDHAEEAGVLDDGRRCWLKGISLAQERALRARLPHTTFPRYFVTKIKYETLLPAATVEHILTFCGVRPERYMRVKS